MSKPVEKIKTKIEVGPTSRIALLTRHFDILLTSESGTESRWLVPYYPYQCKEHGLLEGLMIYCPGCKYRRGIHLDIPKDRDFCLKEGCSCRNCGRKYVVEVFGTSEE